MAIFENNIEIYSSRDKIRNQIIEYAKDQLALENFDFNKSSYLSYLINVLSTLTADNVFYNSNIWRQFFLLTANQRESVINISAMLGYTPELAYPATASILVTIPLDFMDDINTCNFTLSGKTNPEVVTPYRFYAKDIVFSLLNDTTLTISKTGTDDVPVYSAQITEYYYNADVISLASQDFSGYSNIPYEIVTLDTEGNQGLRFLAKVIQVYTLDPDQTSFTIPDLKPYEFFIKDIDFKNGQISDVNIITSNQELKNQIKTANINTSTTDKIWNEYASIPLIPESTNGYVLRSTSRGVKVFFGNGLYGNQPTGGETCKITLHLTNGSSGNVIPGSIIESDYISIELSNKSIKIQPSVINLEPAYDGKDSPSLDEIRRKAITKVTTNERLVSYTDYNSFQDIATELPISTTTHVLKRSDLKRNEICLFTDLIYNDTVNNSSYVVPTRNALWELDTTSDATAYTIRAGDEITIDSETYQSLFNIEVNLSELDSRYYFLSNNLEVPITISRASSSDTKLLPTKVLFQVDEGDTPSEDRIYFELYYTKITTSDLPTLECQVTIPWSGEVFTLPHSSSSSKFYLEFSDYITPSSVPEGEQLFKFDIFDTDTSTTDPLVSCTTSATISQGLEDFMYSQVRKIQNDVYVGDSSSLSDIYWVYDVPVILKEYYDRIDQSKFNFYIMSKIVQWDVSQYRMLTDFINYKFSNTTGYSRNMNLNTLTRDNVIDINPCEIPTATTGDRYAVASDDNPWNRAGGFIAVKSDYNPSGWNYEKLRVNDMFYSTDKDKYYVFNGESIIEPIQNIPINIKLIVWMAKTYSGTDASLVDQIKTTLIETLYPNFGYNKTLLISEIIKIVKSIEGVSNCRVLEPEHDIEFTYEIEDLTESQLLVYTPELIYIDSSSIQVEVRI